MAEGRRATVVFAEPGRVLVREVLVAAGATLAQAVQASGLAAELQGVDVASLKLGVWGRARPADTAVSDGDRIELYRALSADPKIARARRARKTKGGQG